MSCELDGSVTHLYVARPLDLPPLTARAVFDDHRRRGTVIQMTSAELRLQGGRRPRLAQPSACLCRRGGLAAIPVEVEVAPWSSLSSELGIRPRMRFVPMASGWRQQRYLALAIQAAEGLVRVLEDEVREWAAGQLPDTRGLRAA
jgi:hypothetical protein